MTVTSIRDTHLQELACPSEAAHNLVPPGKTFEEGHNQFGRQDHLQHRGISTTRG
jgi:hypothetical protein